jgi:hypothetical protein
MVVFGNLKHGHLNRLWSSLAVNVLSVYQSANKSITIQCLKLEDQNLNTHNHHNLKTQTQSALFLRIM